MQPSQVECSNPGRSSHCVEGAVRAVCTRIRRLRSPWIAEDLDAVEEYGGTGPSQRISTRPTDCVEFTQGADARAMGDTSDEERRDMSSGPARRQGAPLLRRFSDPILHIDMDSFFAAGQPAEDPSLAGKRSIVGDQRSLPRPLARRGRRAWACGHADFTRARLLCPEARVAFTPGRLFGVFETCHGDPLFGDPELEQVSIDEGPSLDVSGRDGACPPAHRYAAASNCEEVGLPASVGTLFQTCREDRVRMRN